MSASPYLLDDDAESGTWPAFVDLLAATTFLFIVLVAVYVYIARTREDAARAREAEQRTTRRELVAALRAASGGRLLYDVEDDEQFVRIVLQEKATFPQGVYTWDALRDSGKVALGEIGVILNRSDLRPLYRQINVLGYSDQDRYPGTGFSNWELSASRAAVVARYLVNNVRVDPCKVSASGLGPYYPRYGQDKERNRRIEIEIVPARALGAVRTVACDSIGDGSRFR